MYVVGSLGFGFLDIILLLFKLCCLYFVLGLSTSLAVPYIYPFHIHHVLPVVSYEVSRTTLSTASAK